MSLYGNADCPSRCLTVHTWGTLRFMPAQLLRLAQAHARAAVLTVVAILVLPPAAPAAELSGVLLFSCATTDDPDECRADAQAAAWHTTIDDTAAPLLVLPGLLPANALKPPLNRGGDLRLPLPYGKTLLTFLLQPTAGRFPARVGVNLYFNGDQLTPGAAAIVPTWAGPALTRFWPNLSPIIPSLYLRDAESPGSVTYSDGQSLVEITALLVAPPQAVARVDRVGPTALRPDGGLDAVVILELTIAPIRWRRDAGPAAAPLNEPIVPPPGVTLLPVQTPTPLSTPIAAVASDTRPSPGTRTPSLAAGTKTPRITTTQTPETSDTVTPNPAPP